MLLVASCQNNLKLNTFTYVGLKNYYSRVKQGAFTVAYTLAREGWRDVTVVERGSELGGLAGTFEEEGSFYPLAYHHILKEDRTLLYFLTQIGAIEDVLWRKITMLFRQNGRFFELDRPGDFYRFPMSIADKLRFCRLMLRAFRKQDWSDWYGRSAADLVDSWGGPGVRKALFEPLTQLKFKLPCSEVSGAWLGARLYFREGNPVPVWPDGSAVSAVSCRACGPQRCGSSVSLPGP